MRRLSIALLLLLASCDVPEPAPSSPGVSVARTACGRGAVVVSSDYASTSVGLVGVDGAVLSASIVSSGSASAGLSAGLSGDVVAASTAGPSGEVVLIDRYPNGVLTFVDVERGSVRAQLSVATGFAANPQDVLEVSPTKAYVSRFESNPSPGREPFDGGGDVLILDPRAPSITGRIAFDAEGGALPRPGRMALVRGLLHVVLQRLDASFSSAADTALAVIDPAVDAVSATHPIDGLANCGALSPSPFADRLALACTGVFAEGPSQLDRAGVVVLDTTSLPYRETLRVAGASLGAPPSSIAWASDGLLLVALFGNNDSKAPDRLASIDASGAVTPLYQAPRAFVLGDLFCATPCTAMCVAASADPPGLLMLAIDAAKATPGAVVGLGDGIGLPPRGLGRF